MTINKRGSVTGVLARIQTGENPSAAADKLWKLAFPKLVVIAERMLRNAPRGAGDGEDIALSAFKSLYDGAAHGRITDLDSRDNLWRVLYTITSRKVHAQKSRETARKRNAHRRVDADIEEIVDHEPGPEFTVMLRDELQFRLGVLRDDTLREIALLVLEGSTNEEIAARFDCSVRTIERKRGLIRTAWEREQPS
jgi:DNA-directed RNA polymerase specialized sigma24 family protein